jgi:hypothetical protein
MKWLANKIKENGFKPGIWSRLILSQNQQKFSETSWLLLKKMDGSLKRIGNWEEGMELPADEN